jgi:DNA repair protein RecO (recombination protein O)
MAHLVKDEGIVLEMRDHAETDRIVTVFTRYHGKLPILVKGARRLTSGSGAYLDLANRVGLIYYRRRGLSLLKEASLIQTFPSLREDLGKLEVALSGLILARDLLPELQPQSEAYFLLLSFLRALDFGVAPRALLLAFGLQWAKALGYGPHLGGCVGCGGKEELTFSPERGGLLCRKCGGEGEFLSPAFWRSLEALQKLPLFAAGRIRLKEEEIERGLKLLQNFLAYQLKR